MKRVILPKNYPYARLWREADYDVEIDPWAPNVMLVPEFYTLAPKLVDQHGNPLKEERPAYSRLLHAELDKCDDAFEEEFARRL